MRRFIFAIALTAFLAVPASADVRIMSSAGEAPPVDVERDGGDRLARRGAVN